MLDYVTLLNINKGFADNAKKSQSLAGLTIRRDKLHQTISRYACCCSEFIKYYILLKCSNQELLNVTKILLMCILMKVSVEAVEESSPGASFYREVLCVHG